MLHAQWKWIGLATIVKRLQILFIVIIILEKYLAYILRILVLHRTAHGLHLLMREKLEEQARVSLQNYDIRDGNSPNNTRLRIVE